MILLTILFLFLSSVHYTYLSDQVHDLLILQSDTIRIKTFPLEELGFSQRPFPHTEVTLSGLHCLRGYQATWEVIDKRLYLTRLVNIHDPNAEIDLVQYFLDNAYTPIVVNGRIFANWYSKSLASYPRQYSFWGCIWKPRKARKPKATVRFENGMLVMNKYKGNKQTYP